MPLRYHRPVITQRRLNRAAAFIAQLARLSDTNPHSWRRAESVGRDVGLAGLPLEQALRDAERAGSHPSSRGRRGPDPSDGRRAGRSIAIITPALDGVSLMGDGRESQLASACQSGIREGDAVVTLHP